MAYYGRTNDTQIVSFTNLDDTTLISTLQTLLPDYIYIIISADKITPVVVLDMNNLTRSIDSDFYTDTAWSIITAIDSANLNSYLSQDNILNWDDASSISVYPTPGSCSASAGSAYLSLSSASQITSSALYIGSTATSYNLPSAYTYSDFLYACARSDQTNSGWYSNETDTAVPPNTYLCPYMGVDDSYYISCSGANPQVLSVGVNNPDALFISDISFSARLSGTSSLTAWNPSNPSADHTDSLVLSFFDSAKSTQRKGISAFLGHLMTRWSGTEHYTKIFTNTLLMGSNLADSYKTLLNALYLNSMKQSPDTVTQDFLEHIASDYVLYASPKMKPSATNNLLSVDDTLTQETSSPLLDSLVYWSGELTITTLKTIPALYDSDGWHSSYASLWITDASALSGDMTNITFVSALYGSYSPDSTAAHISILSDDSSQVSLDTFTVESSQDTNSFISSDTADFEDFYAEKTQNNIIFAYIMSPNESINLGTSKTISFNFTTKAVTYNVSEVTAAQKINYSDHIDNMPYANNLTSVITLHNPYQLTISSLVARIPVASNTYDCSVRALDSSSYIPCAIEDSKLVFSPESLPSGDTQYILNYFTNSTFDSILKRGSVTYNRPYTYNRGDILNITGNISSNESSENYDIFFEIINSTGSMVWHTSLTNRTANTTFYEEWTVPTDLDTSPDGIYYLKNYITESGSNRYLAKRLFILNITSQLLGYTTPAPASISADALVGYYPPNGYLINITGGVMDQHMIDISGANITITVSGGGTETTTTDADGIFSENMTLPATLGEKYLTINMNDDRNNSVANEYRVNITNYLNYHILYYNNSYDSNGFITKGETVRIKAILYNSSSSYTYAGRVNITIDGALSAEGITDTAGVFEFDYNHNRNTDDISVAVTAFSPLNTSHLVTNSSRPLLVRYFRTTLDSLPDLQVSANSNLNMDFNITGTVNFNLDGSQDVANGATVRCYIDSTQLNLSTMTPNVTTTVSNYQYNCPVVLNKTGTYFVRVETEKSSINLTGGTAGITKIIKGYVTDNFRVYTPTTTGTGSSSSSSSAPLTFDEIVKKENQSTIKTKDFDLGYKETIYMSPGASAEIITTINNYNNTEFHNLTLKLSGLPDDASEETAIIDLLEKNTLGFIISTITLPSSTPIKDYTVKAVFAAYEKKYS